MLQTIQSALRPSGGSSLSRTFSRLGWIGFWIQIGVGSIPVALTIYALIFYRNAGGGTRGGLALIEYMSIAGLLVLAFTTIWFYRYTRLATRIADPERRPLRIALKQAAWIGVAASTLGIIFSMLVILLEVAQLLFYFLRAPQAGVPVVQTTAGGPASWVSAADIVSLMVLILTMYAEVIVLAFSVWLLFRAMGASAEYPGPDEAAAA